MEDNRHRDKYMDKSASIKAIDTDKLIQLVKEQAENLYPSANGKRIRQEQVRYNALIDAVRKLADFLGNKSPRKISVDEKMLEEFSYFLSQIKTSNSQRSVYLSSILKLINNLPPKYLNRKLKTLKQKHREQRLDGYAQKTQDAFNHFQKNGMKLKKGTTHKNPSLSNNLLADNLRNKIIDSTLTFLRAIDCNDIFSITEDDVEEYVDYHAGNGSKKTAHKTLDFIRPFFSNLRCRGLIDLDPLQSVPRTKSGTNLDYVEQSEIDKLADLSNLDMDDFIAVRGRTLAFVLDYTYALRNKEASMVKCSDFHSVELRLPKEIQKIKKDTLPIYSYFPDITEPLLKRYLELRNMKSPCTDLLMVSIYGKPLGADGCRSAVQNHCNRLRIKTHEGNNVVNPHRLRHSFGTLNIDPLGIALPLHEIQQQLRHASIQTTYDVYISKNPMHRRLSYEKRMAKINGGNCQSDNAQSQSPSVPISGKTAGNDTDEEKMEENDALLKLQHMGIKWRSFRNYCIEYGKAKKNKKGVLYSSDFINELATNYYTKKEAMSMLGFKRSSFYYWTKTEAIDFILIGNVSLFRKDVVMEKRMKQCR